MIIPLNPLAIILFVILFIIFALASASSNLVCPGFCANPAVITTTCASLQSL